MNLFTSTTSIKISWNFCVRNVFNLTIALSRIKLSLSNSSMLKFFVCFFAGDLENFYAGELIAVKEVTRSIKFPSSSLTRFQTRISSVAFQVDCTNRFTNFSSMNFLTLARKRFKSEKSFVLNRKSEKSIVLTTPTGFNLLTSKSSN